MQPPNTPPAQTANGSPNAPETPRPNRVRPRGPHPPTVGMDPVNRQLFPPDPPAPIKADPFDPWRLQPNMLSTAPFTLLQPAPPPAVLTSSGAVLVAPAIPVVASAVPATQQAMTTAASPSSTTSFAASVNQDVGSAATAQSSASVPSPRKRSGSSAAVNGESAATKRRRTSR